MSSLCSLVIDGRWSVYNVVIDLFPYMFIALWYLNWGQRWLHLCNPSALPKVAANISDPEQSYFCRRVCCAFHWCIKCTWLSSGTTRSRILHQSKDKNSDLTFHEFQIDLTGCCNHWRFVIHRKNIIQHSVPWFYAGVQNTWPSVHLYNHFPSSLLHDPF